MLLIDTPRFCRVHDNITPRHFACEPAYFDKWIKDQPLLITFDYINIFQVQTADGETWEVDKDDVKEVKNEEAAI